MLNGTSCLPDFSRYSRLLAQKIVEDDSFILFLFFVVMEEAAKNVEAPDRRPGSRFYVSLLFFLHFVVCLHLASCMHYYLPLC